uniref:Aa_trans domain-containing protein n=1 Tax=Panagrellus redivivus TaxID=6233 RepID=A0A7E5A0X3_PANRE
MLALTIGPVLDVVFQPPALAGVIRGPITMFIYHNFGYKACKVVVCFAIYTISSILCTQDYDAMFRFTAILPNKAYYEFLNSIPCYFFVHVSTIAASGIIATLGDLGTLLTAAYSTVNVPLTILFIFPFRKFTRRITVDALLKVFGIKVGATSTGVV